MIKNLSQQQHNGEETLLREKQSLKPVVKWAGGKSQLIGEISSRYPTGLGIDIKKYVEPFVGGGAVLFDILEKYELDEVYISDTNAELINMYQKIQSNVDDLIGLLRTYQAKYLLMEKDDRKGFYYKKREEFNFMIQNGTSKDSVHAAALFIFLNRTCFNGLYRVNRKGLFNVSAGDYKNPLICDENNLRNVSRALQNVTIICGDFRSTEDFIDAKTLVYFDPPYRPLSATSSFAAYTKNEFNDAAQAELAQYAEQLASKGAHVILSNSDPKNTDPDDNFFDDLYHRFHIERIFASRMINSNAKARGKISELLIYDFIDIARDSPTPF